jgi:diguanylate cyclase (GGDEF)-like protein/putative nucleotidyltransferase with HDIG domain
MTGHGRDEGDRSAPLQVENDELRRLLAASERYIAATLARATRLSQIISVLGTDTELGHVVGRVPTTVCELFSADLAVLLLGPDDDLTIAGHWGVASRDVPPDPIAISHLERLTHTAPIAAGPAAELGLPAWLDRYHGRHAAWARLAVGDESLGLLLLVRRADLQFKPSDETELQAVASRLAMAVENGLLHQRMRSQIDQMAQLQAFTVDLAATIELSAVAQRVADEVVCATEVQASAVYLEGPEPIAVSGSQAPSTSWARIVIATAAGAVGQLAVPLAPDPNTEASERLAHLLGLAGLALENAIMYERSREQARRDSLTGLLAHRTFHEGLESLGESGVPFTLVLADIDDFKQINDLYGHPAGDEALRAVAAAIKSAVRAQDRTYRIGGEEFCVLLPSLEAAGARSIAERMRQNVEDIDGPLPLTVSIGVATFPDDADSREQLLDKADAALYTSKASGKNMTTLADSVDSAPRPNTTHPALDLRLLHEQDPETAAHSARVANLAVAVARRLGVLAERMPVLRRAAMLHDIGKIGVPTQILHKQGPLDAEEFRIVQTHCVIGAELLRRAGEGEVAQIVMQHHENFDGSGYPVGLAGDQIALESRILRVVDSFDALTLDRPYRRAQSATKATIELERSAGRDFDPAVVDALYGVLAAAGEMPLTGAAGAERRTAQPQVPTA